MQPFDYFKPKDFDEAFQLLNTPGKTVYPYAGGTDFIPMTRDGIWKCDAVVDIKGLPGMHDIQETPEGLFVGAAVRMNEIASSEIVRSHWDILAQGAGSVGSEQIRNRATLGGNLANASPAADMSSPLLALGACVTVEGASGRRSIPLADFFEGPGKADLGKALLVEVVFPDPPGSGWSFQKYGRTQTDISVVNAAAGLAADAEGRVEWARIALGAVAPTPIRASEAEKALAGRKLDASAINDAAAIVEATVSPISDVRAPADYRRHMSGVLVRRALRECAAQLGCTL